MSASGSLALRPSDDELVRGASPTPPNPIGAGRRSTPFAQFAQSHLQAPAAPAPSSTSGPAAAAAAAATTMGDASFDLVHGPFYPGPTGGSPSGPPSGPPRGPPSGPRLFTPPESPYTSYTANARSAASDRLALIRHKNALIARRTSSVLDPQEPSGATAVATDPFQAAAAPSLLQVPNPTAVAAGQPPLRLVAPAPTHPKPPPDADLDGPGEQDDSFAGTNAAPLGLAARVNQLDAALHDAHAQLATLTLQMSLQLETQAKMHAQIQRLEAHVALPPLHPQAHPQQQQQQQQQPVHPHPPAPPASAPPTGPRQVSQPSLPTLAHVPATPISPLPDPFFLSATPPPGPSQTQGLGQQHLLGNPKSLAPPDRARLSPLAAGWSPRNTRDKRHSWAGAPASSGSGQPSAGQPDRPLSRRARRELAAAQHAAAAAASTSPTAPGEAHGQEAHEEGRTSRTGATSPHPVTLVRWDQANLQPELLKAVQAYGLGPPTRVQQRAIPALLAGKDALVQAPPTQERMASYVVCALQRILERRSSSHEHRTWVLVVCTTTDQATQAVRLATGLARTLDISPWLCAGSADAASVQADAAYLHGRDWPELVLGTPARIAAVLAADQPPTGPALIVLDEADQLVARGLSEHVTQLVRSWSGPSSNAGSSPSTTAGSGQTPIGARQTALFSNTVPQDVLALTRALKLRDPVRVLVRRDHVDHPRDTPSPLQSLHNPPTPTPAQLAASTWRARSPVPPQVPHGPQVPQVSQVPQVPGLMGLGIPTSPMHLATNIGHSPSAAPMALGTGASSWLPPPLGTFAPNRPQSAFVPGSHREWNDVPPLGPGAAPAPCVPLGLGSPGPPAGITQHGVRDFYMYIPSAGESWTVRGQAKTEAVAEMVRDLATHDVRTSILAAEPNHDKLSASLRNKGVLPSTLSRSHPPNTRAAALALATQGRTTTLVLSDSTLLADWIPPPSQWVTVWFDLPRSGEEMLARGSGLPPAQANIMVLTAASGPRGDVEVLRTLEAQLGIRYAELPPDPSSIVR